ncbi:glycerate kinase [Butyrivibrio sp. INlla16]|uniref:glycerate kinase family protein n=1 Tax=Butyrivibrio sp. INlla16 TaxID=1520807 RepID=UPI000888FA0D|nr:glycerate kinase [Butyrivibrio sp. INlla16]SDB08227.1 glycerate kinase [Butyrivibrio sp. INlla16]
MKIVTAIDSFKGSMSSIEAGNAFAKGARKADPDIEVIVRPLADGGEGTVDALIEGMNGQRISVTVTGPLGKPVICDYGIISEKKLAVIEMSGAAGITLLSGSELSPLDTTTYGVGEVIRDAIGKGCRRFIVGIGGSATNDGGTGMLSAIGYEFLDKKGEPIALGAKGLKDIAEISDEHVLPELEDCEFLVACDVKNPLCGPTGCSAIYGPQKGATPEMIADMDKWLENYARLAMAKYPADAKCQGTSADAEYPGTGAAGGMGFAFLVFTNATLKPGIELVLEETKLAEYIKDADLVVTGEGMLDAQTAMGKAPVGVAALAKKYGKTVIAFAGSVTEDAAACNKAGIDAYFPIVRGVTTLEEAMQKETAMKNMEAAAKQVISLYEVSTRCKVISR